MIRIPLPEEISVILATDCGSTTSKARLFGKNGGEYRYVASGEAPTTVESPYEDVTLGVRNAVREIEELTGRKLLSHEGIIMPSRGEEGCDLYLTTSSAGGGLQMIVGGVIKTMTAESAERAALGAGAIVMDVISIDDMRPLHEKIERVRHLRPDMILVAGGTDGGTVTHVTEMVELVAAADPKSRFGAEFKLPIVYAGNRDAREHVKMILADKFAVRMVENIRPSLDVENVEPARHAVHEVFMEHVMSHAPGYDKLTKWTPVPIMPTPAGEGIMFRQVSEMRGTNIIGVGLGGATTNIYSVYEGKFVRTVSANLGMSYSICNVLKEAGTSNITRWIPFEMHEASFLDRLRNKMIRPTTIPQTQEELMIEHAVAREAIRLGFRHHKSLARPLRGVRRERTISDFLDQSMELETYIDMLKVDMIGGTGGLLSHVPRRAQSAMVMIDAFQPEGVTKLVQDSVFMMPHLGVLSTVHPKAALEIFEKDCLVRLGTCIAPKGIAKENEEVVSVKVVSPNGSAITESVTFGHIKLIPLEEGGLTRVEVYVQKGFDVGAGPGRTRVANVEGGVVGLIIDARGRPLSLSEDLDKGRSKLIEWFSALNAYPRLRISRVS